MAVAPDAVADAPAAAWKESPKARQKMPNSEEKLHNFGKMHSMTMIAPYFGDKEKEWSKTCPEPRQNDPQLRTKRTAQFENNYI